MAGQPNQRPTERHSMELGRGAGLEMGKLVSSTFENHRGAPEKGQRNQRSRWLPGKPDSGEIGVQLPTIESAQGFAPLELDLSFSLSLTSWEPLQTLFNFSKPRFL